MHHHHDTAFPASGSPPATGTRLAAVLGWPVAHSLSPALHRHWFAQARVDGTMVPLAVRPDDLAATMALLPRLGFLGWNVTLPHKEAALLLVDEADATAQRIGAVNTVLVGPGGRTRGLNTDAGGFIASLQASPGRLRAPWSADSGPAAILGAGGAARAVAVALLTAGAPALRLINRTPERAAALAAELGPAAAVVPWSRRAEALQGAILLVNATSLGMAGQPALEVDLSPLPHSAVVADLVYVPLETDLLRAARACGLAAVDGLGMLLHQAVPGFTHWGGAAPVVDDAARTTLLQALADRSGPDLSTRGGKG